MNHKVSFERTVEVNDHIRSFAVFGSIGAIAVFKTLADAKDFARYISMDHRHTRTVVAEVKLDVRSEVVSGEIAMNNTFVPRHVSQKFGQNGGGVSIIQPERQSDGGWSHVWPPTPSNNSWGG